MEMIPVLQKEFDSEVDITRVFLERVPDDKFDWKPHEKSSSLQNLVIHIAELPGWVAMAFNTTELDFGEMEYEPTPVKDSKELIDLFEESYQKGKDALNEAEEEDLLPEWIMRNGDQILARWNKYEVIRHSLKQTTHHRAQLGVYFRLLDIPVPASYGPSADEQTFA
jgi:uncharacterized damage-inducible protein DinB